MAPLGLKNVLFFGKMMLQQVYPLVNIQNDGKSPFSMGKSTISMAIFNSKLLVYQRVNHFISHSIPLNPIKSH
jgi:hypothetical protein